MPMSPGNREARTFAPSKPLDHLSELELSKSEDIQGPLAMMAACSLMKALAASA